ncbi:uncharacterized protein LOC124253249 [Haliotis rubra]|uniref:uncharacterized protein LOC124253249 n=1 Tax=Haliotis rubra TaxID=36100 RepID=UPI001EE61232|nr:uncharacterized protein LOC124253249 [Haliotis rubra]
MFRLLLIVSLLAVSQAFFFSRSPDWNKLQVTFGINIFSSGTFSHVPRTELAARTKGYTQLSGCGAIPMFAGKRYAKNGDFAVILIFDVNGFIAGIQTGFPINQPNGYPHNPLQNHPFVEHDNHQFITAYFMDPNRICSTGRTSSQYSEEGTGTRLLVQNGTIPGEYITIPMTESELLRTPWTRGRCFPWMGVHYWYDISLNMDCDRFFPVFLMYNGGKLNSFGWAFNANLSSRRFEHPPESQFGRFLNPVPRCLSGLGRMSTLHIYMSNPLRNFC